MSDHDFTNEEFNRMGDILLAELAARENGPISEAFARTAIARQDILTEQVEVINENASTTYYEYHNHGVTVTRKQFEEVYTDPDTYPTTVSMLRALHFPEEILRRPANSLYKQLIGSGATPRATSLLGWYNRNSSPAHRLEQPLHRKEAYSRAGKIAAAEEGRGTREDHAPSKKDIDPGKRNVNNRTSKVIDDINDRDILAGEFYNNISRIPRKNWNHWLKFWDRRIASVEPNKKRALGRLIGRTWQKTFLLGYQVDRTVLYEIWYNSMDSSFSVYDMHGVEMGNPVPTLQEAIRDMIHVIAQNSDSDKENFGVGRTGAELAASLQRTLGNVMSQDVGVMKREQDLRDKELSREAKVKQEEDKKVERRKSKSASKKATQANKIEKQNRREEDRNRFSREYDMMRKYKDEETVQGVKRQLDHAKDQRKKANGEDESGAAKYWDDQIARLEDKLRDEQYKASKQSHTPPSPTEKKQKGEDKLRQKQEEKRKKAASEPRMPKRSEEEEKVDQYDKARMTKMGQETMDRIQQNMAQRQVDLEIEQRKQDMDRIRKDMEAAWHNAEVNDVADLEPLNPQYGIDPTKTRITDDGSMNPAYHELALDLEKQLRAYEQEINQKQSFKKKKKTKGLGSAMDWRSPRQRGIKEASNDETSFLDMLHGDNDKEELPHKRHDKEEEQSAEIEDNRVNQEVRKIRNQVENNPYNKALLLGDVTGSLKSYDKTKIRPASIKATIGNWVRDTFAPNRDRSAQGIKPSFWSRAKMFFRGDHFRADFIIGWSFADRLNLEIWYVTEPDPNDSSRLTSSFYVYDVNAKMVIRKNVPYYRIAMSTVSAKLGVAQ